MSRVWFYQMLGSIADHGRALLKLPSGGPPLDLARTLCRQLLSEKGEASGTAMAREVVSLYTRMSEADRLAFLDMLCTEFAADPQKILAAADAYRDQPELDALLTLGAALESPRLELLRRMNMAPDGTAVLVRMRETLLKELRDRPHLRALDVDLRHLFVAWFNVGFLQIEKLDWRTPAVVLEKLIAYEAVHEIQGWEDLRRRLAPDRRCYAFFHPALRDEPLIFVEVALVKGLAGAIRPLLAEPPPDRPPEVPDTAIFYSISNCQPGLRGISFGNFLIKQVVGDLSQDFPTIKVFSTLSPIPGFRSWLDGVLARGVPGLLTGDEHEKLRAVTGQRGAKGALKALLADPDWPNREAACQALQTPLMRLCAQYLVGHLQQGGPRDPVARFHLGNGARIERINWLADLSPKGLRQSGGLMVNYRYDLDDIESNHEAFVHEGKVATSTAVRALLGRKLAREMAG